MQTATLPNVWPRIIGCVCLAGVAMVVGHVVIMNSGDGEGLTLKKTWISQFAAVPGLGWIIKLSIGLYCVALVDVFVLLARRFACHRASNLLAFAWIMLATAMIGGLLMVAIYDTYDVDWLEGKWDRLVAWIDGPSDEQIAGRHHSIGFGLFAGAFFAASVFLLVLDWSEGHRERMPVSASLVLVALIITGWLLIMREQSALPGIPQRGLLLVVTLWILRTGHHCAFHPSKAPNG